MEQSQNNPVDESKNSELSMAQPKLINIPLFLHQLKSIEKMMNTEATQVVETGKLNYVNTKLGVLADIPGYGKALSMLGLITNTLTSSSSSDNIHYLEDINYFKFVSEVRVTPLESTKCSLILVNVSLLSQWILELGRTLLRYKAVYSKNEIENIPLDEYDVIIVANNVYNLFSQVYRKKSWKRFVVDEPMSLKFHTAMEPVNAQFYWLITATPIELYMKRRTGFMLDLLPEDLNVFNHLIHKNDDTFVRSSYQMPRTFFTHHKCSGNISKLFEGILSTNVLEMIEAGFFEGVMDYLKAPDDEKTIIGAFRQRKLKRIEELQKESSSPATVEKIQNVQDNLNTLEDRISSYIYNNPCIVCGTDFSCGKEAFVLSCCQNICCSCDLPDGRCPVCKDVDTSFIKLEYSNKIWEQVEKNHHNPNKPETVMEIIGNSIDKKVLIFSNYNESFTVLKKFLDEKHLSYLELKGTKEKRDNTIDLYKTGHINILLLDTILSGAGLNLQETTDIILYHEVRQYQEVQILGRAVRIGRLLPLNVHRLE